MSSSVRLIEQGNFIGSWPCSPPAKIRSNGRDIQIKAQCLSCQMPVWDDALHIYRLPLRRVAILQRTVRPNCTASMVLTFHQVRLPIGVLGLSRHAFSIAAAVIQCIARWVPTVKCVESRRAAEAPTTIFDPYRAVVKAPKAPAKYAPRPARLLHKLDGARGALACRGRQPCFLSGWLPAQGWLPEIVSIAATSVGVLTRRIAAEEGRRLGAAPKFSAAVLRPNAPAILAATEGYPRAARLLAVLGDQGSLAGAGGEMRQPTPIAKRAEAAPSALGPTGRSMPTRRSTHTHTHIPRAIR